MPKHDKNEILLLKTWVLPPQATLGSSVRIKGIFQEIRARLPASTKKLVELDGQELTLAMPASDKPAFNAACAAIGAVVAGAESLPVIPREIEDILSIKTSERHRWLTDGRLPSAGTRTVQLRGRAKKITFHVFDPKMVMDLLDRGSVEEWREEDILAAAENRRRAAYKAKLTRTLRKAQKDGSKATAKSDEPMSGLPDWEDFAREGFLR
jgi:hypothetical protein